MNGPSGLLLRQRSCGLIRHDARVLLCREEGDEFWTLPGGSVDAGEFSDEALARELAEELGDFGFRVGALFFVGENHFRWRDRAYQEVVMAYDVSFGDRTLAIHRQAFRGPEPHLTFEWFAEVDVANLDLRPSILLRSILSKRSGGIAHARLRESAAETDESVDGALARFPMRTNRL